MSAGRPRDKLAAEENLLALLGCPTRERTYDGARRVIKERDRLLLKVAAMERALQLAWGARDAR